MKISKHLVKAYALFAIIGLFFASCSDDSNNIVFKQLQAAGEITETTWETGTTVTIDSTVVVPEGKSLTIEPGVKIIFSGSKLGTASAPEFDVRGNLYVLGSAASPVVFTVPDSAQTTANEYLGLWGGIQCAGTCSEVVLNYAEVDYVGAPAGPSSIFVEQGESEGDPRFGLLFGNTDGKLVVHNSTFKYSADDFMRIKGGKISICNNIFAYIGDTGGEAVNVKSGTVGDMSFNMFYSIATNGTKWSNSGDITPQTDCNSYNNTFVNCGWRRNKEGRGGSVNIEKEGRGDSYNQLIVNCRYGVRVVGGEDAADTANVNCDYSMYYGNDSAMVANFRPTNGILPYAQNTCKHDVLANANPNFVKYDISTDKLKDLNINDLDFHLNSGSPAASGAYTGFSPKLSSLSVGGITYTTPKPASYFGCYTTE